MKFSKSTLLALTLSILGQFTHAQDANTQFEVGFEIQEVERKVLVAKNLDLSEQEAAQFWPLYDAYRAENKELAKVNAQLLQRFSENFGNVSAETAKDMVSAISKLENDVLASKHAFIASLEPVLEGAKLLRLFQIETRLEATYRTNLTRKIPLIPASDEEKMAFQKQMEALRAEAQKK